MEIKRGNSTSFELEKRLGEQVRAARIAQELDQSSLASLANVSLGAISNLERGKGSSLSTLVAVVRALGRTDWLESLAPPITVSPLQMLRNKRASPASRVRTRNTAPPAGEHL
jgi:transcriptional regulator with XRE-family HTH domain